MDIRCWNCNKLLGVVKNGKIDLVPSTNIKDAIIDSPYVEDVKCRGCKKINTKILRRED
jgi:phage FluMu protein Com